MLYGREQVLMQQSVPWQFKLQVQTPKTIGSAQLQVQIKAADSLEIVYDELHPAGTVSSGPLEIVPQIPAAVTEALSAGDQYIVVFTLLWRNQRNQLRGSPIQQSVTVMGSHLFDRVQEAGELIALSDKTRWADYWHQIWQQRFDGDTRRADVQTRYYLTLSDTERTHARIDTQVRRQNDRARAKVRLRSGYEYSLFALNHLLQRLDRGLTPLTDVQLRALAASDFQERFTQAAQHQGQFRGRPEDRAALWVYPSMKLQNIVLVKAAQVNQRGVVVQLAEEQVTFPMPAMMHFVGVSHA
jgi:hypothetical protein